MSIINKILGRVEIVEYAESQRHQKKLDLINAEAHLEYYSGLVKVLRKQVALLDGHVEQCEVEAENREVKANIGRLPVRAKSPLLTNV